MLCYLKQEVRILTSEIVVTGFMYLTLYNYIIINLSIGNIKNNQDQRLTLKNDLLFLRGVVRTHRPGGQIFLPSDTIAQNF